MIPAARREPQKSRNISLAILVGLVGGIGLALLREYMDNTVKNPDDIENLARLPSLAVVPAFGSRRMAHGRGRLPKIAEGRGGERPRRPRRTGFALCSRNRRFPRRFARCERRCCCRRPIVRRRSF